MAEEEGGDELTLALDFFGLVLDGGLLFGGESVVDVGGVSDVDVGVVLVGFEAVAGDGAEVGDGGGGDVFCRFCRRLLRSRRLWRRG